MRSKSIGNFIILILIAISVFVTAIVYFAKPIGVVVSVFGGLYLFYQIYLSFFFKSEKFKNIQNEIKEFITNCNKLNYHIQELKCSYASVKSFKFGESTLSDDSRHNYTRREWNKDVHNTRIYNCSATICKNANNQPFKYLCKYFGIESTEDTLSNFEGVLNNFAAVEEGKILLRKERDSILNGIKDSIPFLIYSFSKNKLIEKLGFKEIDFSDLYFPIYTFKYVSPGGNSSMKCDIRLNLENLNKLIYYLSDLLKFKISIEGQRALMTSNLREKIKTRDNFTCQKCKLAITDERHLLLEIDHIIPLSKGGFTSEDNLQTLCWKCNRTKGAKIE